MKVVTRLPDLRSARVNLEEPVGFVPTMGYLHEGHLSLVRRARAECKSVVASIFVNPTQFGPGEDLAAYPRDLERDLALLRLENVDLVWAPESESLYTPGFQTWVIVEDVTKMLEGALRPGHFRGVTTIVAKLFIWVQPDRAYFGQKDAQQTVVIRRMVQDLNFPIQVIVCPTVREPDGLAKSSRNVYLNPDERRAAVVLYQALTMAQQAFLSGERQPDTLRNVMIDTIQDEPLANLQYVSCADPDTLVELESRVERALLSMAIFFRKTRLIDNLLLEG
ncbi:MAG TPA: pantoate--beta-alanine ligase [Anaerolineales bacterium]|nr:pantoate--beta-alanine ligase [Anaerolineales bacterium]